MDEPVQEADQDRDQRLAEIISEGYLLFHESGLPRPEREAALGALAEEVRSMRHKAWLKRDLARSRSCRQALQTLGSYIVQL